jgi:hypothetical protein
LVVLKLYLKESVLFTYRALQQGATSSLFKFRTTKEKGKVIFNNVAVYAQRLIYIYIYIYIYPVFHNPVGCVDVSI